MAKETKEIIPKGWSQGKGYSHAIEATGRQLFLAGQIGWDPLTESFSSDDFAIQVAQALRNIVSVLKAAGGEPGHITRLTWFITDKQAYVNARPKIGEAYREIIGKNYPAMSVVVVQELIEEHAQVEIEATAVLPG